MSTELEPPTHYVAVGASAGGLEAIESLFKEMPDDGGLAFIIIQHLSPDYKSLMPELLSKRTSMDVFAATDGQDVKSNSIYLIPPKKNMRIIKGKLLLSDQDRSGGLNLPIDIFFRSLAEDQGSKAIGIVLSGTGSDGTRGSRALKEHGGMVMAQSESTARFDGMPKSVIGHGLADFVLSPEEMPKQLRAYVEHPFASRLTQIDTVISDDTGMARIFSLLRDKMNIDFTYYKPSTITRRIERRMSITHHHELNNYVKYLESHTQELTSLSREMLIGVTSFFRDPEAFSLLTDEVIPKLLSEIKDSDIRVWVAGCSTGEEAYSLAIMLKEAMEKIGRQFDVKIFATDVDKNAIEVASEGIYPTGIVGDIPKEYLAKYFTQRDDHFQVLRVIREMVVFAQHNLVKDPPFTNIDIVTCRNLLIYLQPILQKKVLEFFNFSLKQNGILFLGMSETTGDMSDYFDVIHHKLKIYQSKGRYKISSITNDPDYLNRTRMLRSRLSGNSTSPRYYSSDEQVLERFLQSFSDDFVQLAFVMNANADLVHFVGNGEGFMQIAPGMATMNAGKLIRKELSIPLSTGLQKVLKTNEALVFSQIRLDVKQRSMVVQMRIKPLITQKGQEPLVSVFISEMKPNTGTISASELVSFDVNKEAEQRIADLEQELQFTRENLQATVEELETSNEELQSTNEELLSSNEELQSTNEELQSVNEELYTVNAEHQARIIELTDLTNDLDNLIDSTEIGTVFLDKSLMIRRFSKRSAQVFKIIENDIGRSITDITNKLGNLDLEKILTNVLKSHEVKEMELRVDNDYLLMRILPYRVSANVYEGLVITLIDVTAIRSALEKTRKELVKTEQALDVIAGRTQRSTDLARIGTWEWDLRTGKAYWSDVMYELFGTDTIKDDRRGYPALYTQGRS